MEVYVTFQPYTNHKTKQQIVDKKLEFYSKHASIHEMQGALIWHATAVLYKLLELHWHSEADLVKLDYVEYNCY